MSFLSLNLLCNSVSFEYHRGEFLLHDDIHSLISHPNPSESFIITQQHFLLYCYNVHYYKYIY